MNGEERKKIEAEYYDKRVEERGKGGGDFEGFDPLLLDSYQFFYKLLEENCKGKTVLDYGCGNGIHSHFPVKAGAEKVVGIDLSEKSLEIAREKTKKAGLSDKVEYKIMDCENLDFLPGSFEVVLDGGTFSSLDLEKALPELARVLRPEGVLLGIETFGHNPLTNLKRKLNRMTGRRTGWAERHIFNSKYLDLARNYFEEIEIYYFHLVSWAVFPFLNFPGGKFFLKFMEIFDRILLKVPFLKKFAFKVVFIFSKPKK